MGVVARRTVILAIGRRTVRWFEASVGHIMRPCPKSGRREGKWPRKYRYKEIQMNDSQRHIQS